MSKVGLQVIAGLAFGIGGVVGGGIGWAASFWLLFLILRLLSSLVGNDDLMLLMWFQLLLGPLAAVVGFSSGGVLARGSVHRRSATRGSSRRSNVAERGQALAEQELR